MGRRSEPVLWRDRIS